MVRMAKTIKSNEVADEIQKYLSIGLEQYTNVMKEVVDEISAETNQEIKSHISFKDKNYSKHFAIKPDVNLKRRKVNIWHVKAPYYRLTHLLEFGHLTRLGQRGKGKRRTAPFPHVQYGTEYVRNNFADRLKERIEQCQV